MEKEVKNIILIYEDGSMKGYNKIAFKKRLEVLFGDEK
jgi:hypothetical protein